LGWKRKFRKNEGGENWNKNSGNNLGKAHVIPGGKVVKPHVTSMGTLGLGKNSQPAEKKGQKEAVQSGRKIL